MQCTACILTLVTPRWKAKTLLFYSVQLVQHIARMLDLVTLGGSRNPPILQCITPAVYRLHARLCTTRRQYRSYSVSLTQSTARMLELVTLRRNVWSLLFCSASLVHFNAHSMLDCLLSHQ